MRARALAPLLLFALARGQAAQVVAAPPAAPEVLWRDERGPGATNTDLVFLPDGFRAEERAAYEASVKRAIAGLERHPATFLRPREAWNLHVAFVPSEEACPARAGRPARRTAFATRVAAKDEGGLFESDDERIAAAARAVSAGVDATIVVVRAERAPGFATGDLPFEGARVRLPEGMEEVLLHELGHSLFALGDEYAGRDVALPDYESSAVAFYPNVTRDPAGERFRQLVGAPVPLAEGALDFGRGVWRAAGPCVMDDPAAERFCAPCRAVLDAGLPAHAPEAPPRLELVAEGTAPPRAARLEPAGRGAQVVRGFAVLFTLTAALDDAALHERFRLAHARLSQKTRFMESPWIGDGSAPGERVFSLEGQVREIELSALAPGDYALLAAWANLRGPSPAALVRFSVR